MKREVWADEQVAAVVNAQFIPVAIDVGKAERKNKMSKFMAVV